jgi:hypothetical protein
MRNGRAFQRVLWAPAIKEIGGGLLRTPRSHRVMAARLEAQQTAKRISRGKGPNLEEAIAWMLPTPVARDWKGRSQRGDLLPDSFVPTGGGIYLNPSFVEEMMGFPIGWTV